MAVQPKVLLKERERERKSTSRRTKGQQLPSYDCDNYVTRNASKDIKDFFRASIV